MCKKILTKILLVQRKSRLIPMIPNESSLIKGKENAF